MNALASKKETRYITLNGTLETMMPRLFHVLTPLAAALALGACSNEAADEAPADAAATGDGGQAEVSEPPAVQEAPDPAATLAAALAWLEDNAGRDGVITTDSGLQYEILVSGDASGATPQPGDMVTVHYEGTLTDGSVFDSSYERGAPATFPSDRLIRGWVEALQLMRPGDQWRLFIPPELGYGARGAGQSIGPNEVLVFKVELISITPREAEQ